MHINTNIHVTYMSVCIYVCIYILSIFSEVATLQKLERFIIFRVGPS